MASTTFIKETGFTGMLSLLLLGIFLPSVLSATSMSPNATDGMNGTAMPTPPMSMIYCPSFMCNYTDCYMMYASQNATSCIAWSFCQLMRQTDMSYIADCVTSCAESCADDSQTSCSVNCCNATGCLNATFASMMTMTTTTAATQTSTTMTTSMDWTTQPSNSTGMNGTTMIYTPPMNMIYCPSFMCNYSDCYMMYDSQNATSCALGCCQLMRQTDMSYVASCVATCAESCVNTSQTNCSVNCCNSTGCLNATFASMMMTTTTDMTRTTTVATTTTKARPATTMMASSPAPTADNGKKCNQGTCTGSTCYMDFAQAAHQTCSSAQPHCQLKKEMVNSEMKWTAGCTTNCSAETPCKKSTTPPCHLECCNATMTSSCLFLNGTLNVPNFATRGPHLNTELGASLLCLLAIALLL